MVVHAFSPTGLMALYVCMCGSSEGLTFWGTLPSKDVEPLQATQLFENIKKINENRMPKS